MNYQSLKNHGTNVLEDADVPNPSLDAFYLLEHLTGFDKQEFLMRQDEEVPDGIVSHYEELLKRRAGREPLQYITKDSFFMGLEFKVSEDVLIPRQDTEVLAEEAIETLKEMPENAKVLDLCTGSGAIAISVKHYCPLKIVTGVDISDAALEVAWENAQENETDVTFVLSDMFEELEDEKFDMIISNPPYVTSEEYEVLMPEVKNYEPKTALVAGEDGLDYYRIIAKEAKSFLNPKGFLLLEIGCNQALQVKELIENDFEDIKVLKDLQGLDRVIKARLK